MKIYKSFLIRHDACKEAIEWYDTQKDKDIDALFKALIKDKEDLEWFNWYLSRRLKKIDKVRYAVFAARQVLHIFEDKYPDDDRPRKAIEAAEAYIKNPNSSNANAADTAAASYYASAVNAASAAAYSARSARTGSYYAAYSARAARTGSYYAASYAVSYAITAGGKETMIRILEYGIKLLKGE